MRCMASVEVHARVLAFQRVSGLPRIEGLSIPLHYGKVFPVVFRVAADALLARSGRKVIRGVQALAFGQSFGNFGMAIQAFESGLA